MFFYKTFVLDGVKSVACLCFSVLSVASADEDADRREAEDPGQNEEDSRPQTLSKTQKSESYHHV